ncbi:MAG TPA: hypothetical protein VMW04_03060 [Patescibacteria group bacterium]|nr:hypothetical protein [Patescibacteria group bacterium]
MKNKFAKAITPILIFLVFFLFCSASTVLADTCPYLCGKPANIGGIPCNDTRCSLPENCPQCRTPAPASFFGSIAAPQGVSEYGDFQTGLVKFMNVLLKLLIGAAGLFAFFNIIIAGYSFMGAGGDAKKVEQAWARIWQSLLGLLFVAGSFVLAAIFGWLIFGDARAILVPTIYGP